jgi:acyl carrier protein
MNRADLIEFLVSIARPGRPIDGMEDSSNLIDAGVIDSLALIQIIQYLEQRHGINLQASGIDPNDLSSIAGILAAADQAGG